MRFFKMSDDPLPSIALIVIFLICSALFSATETAFSSVNRTRLRNMAENGDKKALRTLDLFDNYDNLLTSILVGNNIVNIAMASVSAVLFVGILPNSGATVSTIVITVAVLIFGEISPKTLARENPERFAIFTTPVMRAIVKVLTPVNILFSKWQDMLRRVFKLSDKQVMTNDELSMLVEEVTQEGSIDEEEGDLLRSAIAFQGQDAENVITPRVDVEALSVDTPNDEAARIFADSQYSRLPVYEGSIDHIVGILYEKDFYTETGISETPIKDLMREPVFVPPTMKIDDLLRVFKERRSHIAIVSDEFGGTMGIVTMEDILEELVGEIWDEHDEEVEIVTEVGDDTYRILGSADMDQLEHALGEKLESEGSTAGGWVMEQMGHIPVEGESFKYKDFTVTVTEADSNRVVGIEVQKEPSEDEEE